MVYHEAEHSPIKEHQPLNHEKIFVIGGASGTGAKLAEAVHGLGAQVIISSTREEKLGSIVQTLGRERVHAFVADLTKPEEFYEGLTQLINRDGIVPTTIVHSAAGGMEGFSMNMLINLRRLARIKDPQELEEKLREERNRLKESVLKDKDSAMAVNFHGHAIVLSLTKGQLPAGAKLKDIYWSSIWSDLGKMDPAFKDPNDISDETGIDVPTFYLGVAGSKGRFVRWQKEHASQLIGSGVYPANVSGHIIIDSDVGKMIDRFILSTLLPKDQHEEMKKYYITKQDMVNATIDIIQSDPTTWPEYPHRIFVVGGRPVSRDLSPNDPMFEVKIPL